MIKALSNVMPRWLLDRRLNPVGEVSKAIATQLEELDDVPAHVPLIPLMLLRSTSAGADKLKPGKP